jgi:type IX secretion system PorP/SprF family membrane protein
MTATRSLVNHIASNQHSQYFQHFQHNNTMKKIILFTYISMLGVALKAQQEQQFTQFMFNKLAYNAAYAGSNNAACATVMHRSQWIGFDGAPNAQLISFDMPLMNGRVGAGGNIVRQSIGVEQRYSLDANYAYRIPLAKGNLGLGLSGSVRYRGINFNDPRLVSTTPLGQDAAIEQGYQAKFLPNVGVGAYFNTEHFYLGASVPRLIQNNLSFGETNVIGREAIHAYFMGGFIYAINSNLKVQPQTLVKVASRAPLIGEANVNFIYQDKYTAGVTYRAGGSTRVGFGESIDLLLAIQANDKITFGFSYDYSLSELRNANSGSFEIAVRYCFKKSEGTQFVNPRFF